MIALFFFSAIFAGIFFGNAEKKWHYIAASIFALIAIFALIVILRA